MIQNTHGFIRTVRDIYLTLDKNYTPYLKLDALRGETVDPESFFHPQLMDAFEKDASRLTGLAPSADGHAGLSFTDRFDFKVSDRQKAHGTGMMLEEVRREIHRVKSLGRPVRIVSLGVGDGGTALKYAEHLAFKTGDAMTGLDLHEPYLEAARQRIPDMDTLKFDLNRLAKGRPLPVEDASADIAESTMVAHHIEDFESLVADTCRILKPGGSFLYLDLVDKTAREPEMAFPTDHAYPPFHGVEFFRDHQTVKQILSRHLGIYRYRRIGPGILFAAGKKP